MWIVLGGVPVVIEGSCSHYILIGRLLFGMTPPCTLNWNYSSLQSNKSSVQSQLSFCKDGEICCVMLSPFSAVSCSTCSEAGPLHLLCVPRNGVNESPVCGKSISHDSQLSGSSSDILSKS